MNKDITRIGGEYLSSEYDAVPVRPLKFALEDYLVMECPTGHKKEIVAPALIQRIVEGEEVSCGDCFRVMYKVCTSPRELLLEERMEAHLKQRGDITSNNSVRELFEEVERELSEGDSLLMAEKLVNPPEPNEKLKELFSKDE